MKNTLIAIFEDSKINNFIYSELLNHIKEPMECFLFSDIEKGFEMAKQIQFDIVFIEIHFRGDDLSGIGILKKLKEIQPKDFISVAMASLIQNGDRELILSSGFSMFIEKPLVIQKINSLLKP